MTKVPDEGLWRSYSRQDRKYHVYRWALAGHIEPVTREVYEQRRKECKLKSLLGVKP